MRVNQEKSTHDPELSVNSTNIDKTTKYLALAVTLAVVASETALAGTTGTELQGAYDSVNDLVGGYGGRIIVIGGIAASSIIGYVRQNVTIAASGIGLSLLVANAPAIADGMVSATI